ncbi:MAG: homocysteine S-methyltransferase family protein, partial [bacterium]
MPSEPRSGALVQRLQREPLLADGAMGTMLYARGVPLDACFDVLNLQGAKTVQGIHREYVAAGADAIETNTFGANRIGLAKHGFSERVEAINRAGVELARRVAGDEAFVAGAVGPTGVKFAYAAAHERELALDALREQIAGLA